MARQLHVETPLIESATMGKQLGATIWLKMEALQPSGSFKNRGMGHACRKAIEGGASELLSSSGGNAGLAVAYSARQLGVPATVVVPKTTKPRSIELIEAEGAQVVVTGDHWGEAHEHATSLAGDDVAYMHPFDDPDIWTGHASVIDEVAEAGIIPDLIVLSVGGGGLMSGVVEGVRRNGWPDIPILAVETDGAASLHECTIQSSHANIGHINSIATSLGATQVCTRAYELLEEYPVITQTVTDEEAVDGCRRFLADHDIVVEPACGASLAAVYKGGNNLTNTSTILVIVCGGSGVTEEQLNDWHADFQQQAHNT